MMTQVLMHEQGDKPSFHKIDVFHTVSLGVGKLFASSSLALLQALFRGGSLSARFAEMSVMFLEYCKDAWC